MEGFAFFSSLADFPSALQLGMQEFNKKNPDAIVKFISQSQSGTHPDETAVCLTIFYERSDQQTGNRPL